MHELLPQLDLGIPTSAQTPKDSETLFLSFLDSRHFCALSLPPVPPLSLFVIYLSVSVSSLQHAKCNNTNMEFFSCYSTRSSSCKVRNVEICAYGFLIIIRMCTERQRFDQIAAAALTNEIECVHTGIDQTVAHLPNFVGE
jgi:hypothetical protein